MTIFVVDISDMFRDNDSDSKYSVMRRTQKKNCGPRLSDYSETGNSDDDNNYIEDLGQNIHMSYFTLISTFNLCFTSGTTWKTEQSNIHYIGTIGVSCRQDSKFNCLSCSDWYCFPHYYIHFSRIGSNFLY